MQDSPHIQILKFQGHAANEWDDFVFAYSPGNLWQSWRWGDYQQLLGRRLWRFALTVDGQIEGLAQIIEMSTFWGHKTALLSNGPVLSPIGLPHANVLLQNLRRLLQAPKVMRLLIEPSSLLPQSPLFWKPLRTSNSQPLAAVPSFAMAVPRAAATLQEAFTARARAALAGVVVGAGGASARAGATDMRDGPARTRAFGLARGRLRPRHAGRGRRDGR